MKKINNNNIILGQDGHGYPPKGISTFRLGQDGHGYPPKETPDAEEEIILGRDGHGYPPVEVSGASTESHSDSSSDDA